MKPQTKALRQALKNIDGAWVRVYPDGTVWAGKKRDAAKLKAKATRAAKKAKRFETLPMTGAEVSVTEPAAPLSEIADNVVTDNTTQAE